MNNILMCSFSRPNNTIPYSAGDVIGTSEETGNLPYETETLQLSGLTNRIGQVRLISSESAKLPVMELWLFNAARPTEQIQKDNYPFKCATKN
jgi:hypothetical protein